MNFSVILTFTLLLNCVLGLRLWPFGYKKTEDVADLCADTVIDSADRMVNNTIRVYRGDYYWDLIGLPDATAHVTGPFKVWLPNMLPINRSTSVMTVVTGGDPGSNGLDGFTYKFVGNRYWAWNEKGQQIFGDKDGGFQNDIFPDGGYTAVYCDGNMDKDKSYSMMIGFQSFRAYYVHIKYPFTPIDNLKGYEGGKYGEMFPSDLTAAFAFPSVDNQKIKYYVYLFKQDKYCFRPVNGEKDEIDCETKWRPNAELFGCLKTSGKTNAPQTTDSSAAIQTEADGSGSGSDGNESANPGEAPKDEKTNFAVMTTNQNMKVIPILITYSMTFFYLFK